MRLLITGICGFVGSALARALPGMMEGLEIVGLDNLIRNGSHLNRADLTARGIRVFHGDLRVASDLETLPPCDWVIDAAANPSVLAGFDGQTSSRQLLEHNLGGTLNLLEYCKRHRAGFLLLSTSRVYAIEPLTRLPLRVEGQAYVPDPAGNLPVGLSPAGITEEFSTEPPLSLYGTSKRCSETLALEYGRAFDFPVWIDRCGVLAGPGQFGRADQGIFSFWIHSWRARRPLKYIGFEGHGHQVRDALHPADLAVLVARQITRPDASTTRLWNVAGGGANACSLAQLSAWCADRLGPHPVASDTTPRPFDLPWVVLDSRRAGEFWSWRPGWTLPMILEEIAVHAEQNPRWLEMVH